MGVVFNQVWIKIGFMVVYQGDVKFECEGMMDYGFSNMLKKQFMGEGVMFMKVFIKSCVQFYFVDSGKCVMVFYLQGEFFVVNGDDFLVFEFIVMYKIIMMKKFFFIVFGGFYNV